MPFMSSALSTDCRGVHVLIRPSVLLLSRACVAGVLHTPYKLYMLIDYVPGGDLFQQLQENHGRQRMYSEQHVAEIMVQVLDAVAYLHSKGIAHRDLKPDNLLLRQADSTSSSGGSEAAAAAPAPTVVLCDFGFARHMDERDGGGDGSGAGAAPITPGGPLAGDAFAEQLRAANSRSAAAGGGGARGGATADGATEGAAAAAAVPGGAKLRRGLSLGSQRHLELTTCGTPHYIAPEVIRSSKSTNTNSSSSSSSRPKSRGRRNGGNGGGGGYDCKCDVWSLGVILHVLLVGFPPFDLSYGESVHELYDEILHKPVEEECLAHQVCAVPKQPNYYRLATKAKHQRIMPQCKAAAVAATCSLLLPAATCCCLLLPAAA